LSENPENPENPEKILNIINNNQNNHQNNELIISPLSNPYLHAATSDNTRRAYQADIRHYEKWGGILPATTESILAYLQTYAAILKPQTLSRRLTALMNWHVYQQFPDPTRHPLVSKTLSGIMRLHGSPKKQALPLLPEQLIKIVQSIPFNCAKDYRDNALLQVGFLGAFRRSELVNIHCEHLAWQEQGIDILVPFSKTDQYHEGLYCALPYGNQYLCAVTALRHWLDYARITSGPIFTRCYRDGRIDQEALAPLSVNLILKQRANEAGLEQAVKFSSHSLRRGLATSASRDGATLPAIMRQGRWKNVNTVMEYIEAAQRFHENAADLILKKQVK
jgi:integrase